MTFRLVFAIILLVCGLIGLVIGNRQVSDIPARWIGAGLLACSALFFLMSTVCIVAPGEVGIPVVFGKTGTPIGAGVHFVNPFTTIETLSVRTENYTMSGTTDEGSKTGNDAVAVLGADGAPAEVESTVLFHLNEGDAGNVYRELGVSYVEKIIRPAARGCIRDQFGVDALVLEATTGRAKVSGNVQACIEKATLGRGVTLRGLRARQRDARSRARAAADEAAQLDTECAELRNRIDQLIGGLVDPPTIELIPTR